MGEEDTSSNKMRVNASGLWCVNKNANEGDAEALILNAGSVNENTLTLFNLSGDEYKKVKDLVFGSADGDQMFLEDFASVGDKIIIGLKCRNDGSQAIEGDIVGDEDDDLTWPHKSDSSEAWFQEKWGYIDFVEDYNAADDANINSNAFFEMSNKLYVPQLIVTSDKRYKKNIEVLSPDILEKVSNIKGYSFGWKYGKQSPTIGLLSQEVEKEFPALITHVKHDAVELKKDTTPKKVLNYLGMVGVLVDCINSLNNEVKDLKTQVKLLQEKL